jgi:hypothetical protein
VFLFSSEVWDLSYHSVSLLLIAAVRHKVISGSIGFFVATV